MATTTAGKLNGLTQIEMTRSALMRADKCSRLNFTLLEQVLGIDSASLWIGNSGKKDASKLRALAESKLAPVWTGAKRAVLTVKGVKVYAWQVEVSKDGKFYRRTDNGAQIVGALADLVAACGKANVIVGNVDVAIKAATAMSADKASFAFSGIELKAKDAKLAPSKKAKKDDDDEDGEDGEE